MLNGFVLDALPLSGKVSVLKVNYRCSDRFISEDLVVVHRINNEWRTSWEDRLEIVAFVELWVGLIFLVGAPLIISLVSNVENQVGVRGTAVVTRGKVEGVNHVDTDHAL